MKDYSAEVKDDKSLWERMNIEDVGRVLLVEETYYDYIVETVEQLERTIKRKQKEIEAMKRYISNGIEFGYIDDREKAYEKFTKSK
jgi:BioD-like phosphotransacetylase family protein